MALASSLIRPVVLLCLLQHKLDVEAKPDVDFDVTLEVARIKTLCCHNQAEQQVRERCAGPVP
jgi:hypothetical protein